MLVCIFVFNVIFLIYLGRKFGVVNPIFLGFVPFFVYGQSFFMDNLFLGIDRMDLDGFERMNIDGARYLSVEVVYFLFLIGYAIVPLLIKKSNKVLVEWHAYRYRTIYNIVLNIFFSFILMFMVFQLLALDRFEKISVLRSNKLLSIPANIATFGVIILFLLRRMTPKKNNLFLILFVSVIGYGIIEGGREIFVYIGISYLFSRENIKITIPKILGTFFLLGFVILWKPISVFILQNNDPAGFMLWMGSNFSFSISGQDPKASVFMISDYIEGSSFYEQFRFSYITNTVMQFLRTFKLVSYQSIGERVVYHYNPKFAKKGGGLAFSGILESLLNFWYLGPLVLGAFLSYVSARINSLKFKDRYLYILLSTFFVILCLKLVRTEMAVVLKIYVLPMLIAYFLFYKFTYKTKMVWQSYK